MLNIHIFPSFAVQETVWTKEEFSSGCTFCSVPPNSEKMQGISSISIKIIRFNDILCICDAILCKYAFFFFV